MLKSIEKDKKYRKLVSKSEVKRLLYKSIIHDMNIEKKTRADYRNKFHKLSRLSCKVKVNNRCIQTGRSKSVLRLFKLSRIRFRDLASQGLLVGVTKSSW